MYGQIVARQKTKTTPIYCRSKKIRYLCTDKNVANGTKISIKKHGNKKRYLFGTPY